jgi:hypothetical protein
MRQRHFEHTSTEYILGMLVNYLSLLTGKSKVVLKQEVLRRTELSTFPTYIITFVGATPQPATWPATGNASQQ